MRISTRLTVVHAGRCLAFVAVLLSMAPAVAWAAGRNNALEQVRARGHVICGTAQDERGFSATSVTGQWSGFYIDFCRSLAAAVLGDADAVKFRVLAGPARFKAIADGEVDVLARGTAWTFARDAQTGVAFVVPFFHDGTGFMIRGDSQISSALELSGASICYVSGSLTEVSISRFFNQRGMKFVSLASETWSEAVALFAAGRCSVLAADSGRLGVERSGLAKPEDYVLLPETVSSDVFGPVVRAGDERWFKIVRWLGFALIRAEELDLDSLAIVSAGKSDNPAVRQFAKAAAAGGVTLGLDADWIVRAIRSVGNYAEIFERNLGKSAGINLERGRNALVSDGGVLYSPAFR